MAIVSVDTMVSVPKTKRVRPAMLKRVGEIVAEIVRDRFDGNQTRAAKALDCTQSHISAMITGARGPGLNTLIALRDLTGRTIDDLLGLSSAPADSLVHELTESIAYIRSMQIGREQERHEPRRPELHRKRKDPTE